MTKVKYGLFVTKYSTVITIAEQINNHLFIQYYEGPRLIEEYESESWDDAVEYLQKKEKEYHQRSNPELELKDSV